MEEKVVTCKWMLSFSYIRKVNGSLKMETTSYPMKFFLNILSKKRFIKKKKETELNLFKLV